jgi:ADP-heptose:LPS heptosyltransferase
MVEPAARPLLDGNPALERAIAVPPARSFHPREALAALRAARAERCDAAFDFQDLWKSAVWARASGAPRVIGQAGARREPWSRLLLGETVDDGDAVHVIDRNLALLRAVGIDEVGTREFPLPAPAPSPSVEAAWGAVGPSFAILNPGGGWASKLWPAEHHGVLARSLAGDGIPSLVTWGPGEQSLADRVVAASGGAAVRCPPTTLLDYVELARRASVVIGADTGPVHLACAVGTPVVAVFGPTDPARNGPFSAHDLVVRRPPPCAPCHRRRCPRHEGVMADITVEEVAAAVERRLGRARAPAAGAR